MREGGLVLRGWWGELWAFIGLSLVSILGSDFVSNIVESPHLELYIITSLRKVRMNSLPMDPEETFSINLFLSCTRFTTWLNFPIPSDRVPERSGPAPQLRENRDRKQSEYNRPELTSLWKDIVADLKWLAGFGRCSQRNEPQRHLSQNLPPLPKSNATAKV